MPQSQTTDQPQHRKEEHQNADSQRQEDCKVKLQAILPQQDDRKQKKDIKYHITIHGTNTKS